VGKICTKNDCSDGTCDIDYRLDSTATLITVNNIDGTSSRIDGVAFGNGTKGSRLVVRNRLEGGRNISEVIVATFRGSLDFGEGFFNFEGSANPDESPLLSFFISLGGTRYTPNPLSQVPLGGLDRCRCTNGDIEIACNSERGKICCLNSLLFRQLTKKLR